MPDYSLVPVDYQPDFGDYSLVPVDYDPFATDGVAQQSQIQYAQAQPQSAQPQPQSPLQQPATGVGQPNVGTPANNVEAATSGPSYDPNSPSGVSGSGPPNNPPAAPISPPGAPALANQQQPGGPEPAGDGESPSFGRSLLQGAINATVPGAYYAGLAQQQFRQGNYGAAALYGAESFVDAALGVVTLGASTQLGTAARAAKTIVPATIETAGGNVAYKLETYLLDPDHVSGGPKADWFKRALGFTRENAADLAKQLVFDESQAVQTSVTQHGRMFNQIINVTGANGRTIPVRTTWRIGPDGVPRLVTALPRS